MERLSPQAFEAQADAWDRAVLETPDIDQFCSASAWILSAHEELMGERKPWIVRSDAGWVSLARGTDHLVGTYLEPLEAMWGFASPFAGGDATALVDEVIATLNREPAWSVVLLSGLAPHGVFFRRLTLRVPATWRVLLGRSTRRLRASLRDGFGGFLSRRSSGFRQNLRRGGRRARAHGVVFETLADFPDAEAQRRVFRRILDVERRSWKGITGVGIQSGRMREFYRRMVPQLARRSALRVAFARRDGQDLAYHFGGIFDESYRGLQHGYDARYRALSLGALTHAHMIREVCQEGLALYDLGQFANYKRRWSETEFSTVTLVLVR